MGAHEPDREFPNASKDSATATGLGQAAVFDREAALARVDGDLALLQELIRIFLDDVPRQLAEIRQAIAAKDASRLARVAHSLGGAVGNFGAKPAHDAALRLEAISTRTDMTRAAAAAMELEQALECLRPALLAVSEGPSRQSGRATS
jgi:HPt (histidine-containing phosphotransfer) domain-containing protein